MTTKRTTYRFFTGTLFAGAFAALFVAFQTAPALAQAAPAPPVAPTTAPTPDYNYILGPSDVVHIEALNHADFNVKTTIGADGTIQLPYIGSFTAANMTVAGLHDHILAELKRKGIFSNVTLSVEVVSFGSRYVTVLGGVGSPGLVPVDRAYHLSEMLARAGGVHEGGSDYVVLTTKDGTSHKIKIEDLAAGGPALDPYVSPGDKIYVPTAVFYIKGQIKGPGSYPVLLNMSLAMALAKSGGLTEMGSNRNITITRNNTEIDPKDLSFQIQPNDIIDVGESWF
jgi:polysaccharide export outer membrane protein